MFASVLAALGWVAIIVLQCDADACTAACCFGHTPHAALAFPHRTLFFFFVFD
jgi:hypothetical protein